MPTISPLACAYSLPYFPFSVVIQGRLYKSNANWPFHLIIHCKDVHPIRAQYRKFKPRSDFLISESLFPRLLVEVNSTAAKVWPLDLIRMLLQGAALVRFANEFLGDFKEKRDFVLIAIFVRDAGTATRYALFQTGSPQDSEAVCYAIYKRACRLSYHRFITAQKSLSLIRQLAVSNSPDNSIIFFTN